VRSGHIFPPDANDRALGWRINGKGKERLNRIGPGFGRIGTSSLKNALVELPFWALPSMDELLVFDLSQGWARLCAFLGVEAPTTAFPHRNTREQYTESNS
jgi:hypothetical protein